MIKHYSEVEPEPVGMAGAAKVAVRWLIADREGAPNFYMRLFEVEPGGYSPRHEHDYEHEIFFLEGRAVVLYDGEEYHVGPGYVAYIPPNIEHQIRNVGEEPLRFICLIPASAKK